jgi:AraC-like DNA-binding protein
MKAILEKVPETHHHSFEIEHVDLPHFISPLHFHNETEIIYILESSGTLFAGDKIRKFEPGNIAIIGQGLPHVWMNDKEYLIPKSKLRAKSIVFKFREHLLGTTFLELPETHKINMLLKQSKRGMLFHGWTRKQLAERITEISSKEGFERILHFLGILHTMSRSNEIEFLASEGYSNASNATDCERIDRVYQYVINNFQKPIELKTIAGLANMCETAFCRYFKSRTTKTFTRFLNEVRVGYACKLLIEKKHTPLEICYMSGYNYPSNFHKQFKKITSQTPLEYQQNYWRPDIGYQ